ncbi:hypothetical protein CVT24_005326 [Panaeolus cyanescens]|uniref:Uncharacterized protein n=1 Tax=Panaeolus cyanescens TaxID=181874 RepID=A0A409Y8Y1_9AGAR|nr:hypothetical protein CVT24_005326 [Panaeolus cyanescens]
MPQDKEKAESLKALANELYSKKDFKGAYQKYTEAIKADGTNAIYYANRAAASLGMQQFMNACTDADKAIELDPKYAKAHARYAAGHAGLGRFETAAKSWRRALALLPQVDSQLSPTERKLKEQFEAELSKAETNAKAPLKDAIGLGQDEVSKTPWHRAIAEEQNLRAEENANSSGWLMIHAYREFSEGVDAMKSLKVVKKDGRQGMFGRLDCIVNISNGLMREPRVFHINSPDWFEKLNNQIMFEVGRSGGWSNVGPKVIMEDAPKRLRKGGWESVRPAISTTVRAWIVSGCLSSRMSNQSGPAYEFFSRAIELLEWGRIMWKDVSTEERGVVFERSFIRGIKRMKLESMIAILVSKENCSFTKKKVADEALHIIEDAEANPPQGTLDPGFVLSFWVYPRAEAMAAIGWYHIQSGFASTTAETAKTAFSEAHKFYLRASQALPPDEENTFQYLYVALEALWFAGESLQKQLPLLSDLDTTGQKIMRFWAMSSASERTHGHMAMTTAYRNQVMSGLSSGKYELSNVVKPINVKSVDKFPNSATIYVKL